MSIVGARPQFVKLSPMDRALRKAGCPHTIVHTGQHYDTCMSDVFFRGLAIPDPEIHLGVGSGSHATQTGRMVERIEGAVQQTQPDWVLLYGDTNSTLAGAIASTKIGVPTAHLEAGLRSWNRQMPEELNRVLTDHASDLLLAPTTTALANLESEGLAARSVLTGDVMADLCLAILHGDFVTEGTTSHLHLPSDFVLATLHRPSNVDDPIRLQILLQQLGSIDVPTLLLVHPRLREASRRSGLPIAVGSVAALDPQPYATTMELIRRAKGVVTDSGGIQKEAYLLRTPCTTLRAETEWPETTSSGWNVLDPDADRLHSLAVREEPDQLPGSEFGNGLAAENAVLAMQHG